MSDTIVPVAVNDQSDEPAARGLDWNKLAAELVEKARVDGVDGVDLLGPGWLTALTKQVLETAPEAKKSEQLGYETQDRAGRQR